jgi:uncharacterized protein YlxW (UPF0749 family)
LELTEEKLRKFFLEAFDRTVIPRLNSIDEEISEMRNEMNTRFKKIGKELLDLKEFTIPRIIELQENSKFIAKEVNELAKGGGQKRTAQEIRGLEKLISRLKKELDKVNSRITKFEQKLKEIRESQKRKTAK